MFVQKIRCFVYCLNCRLFCSKVNEQKILPLPILDKGQINYIMSYQQQEKLVINKYIILR